MTVERLRASLAERYTLESELGQGGMATVYLARDLKHDRQVAVKVLRPELAAILGRERFLAEVRNTARLDHPHILTLLDSGESDGFVWYTLPYIRGESLRHKLDRETQLSVDEAVSITRQIAGALEHAHQHGIIHRDVKPENILLHEGEAMLADFGIALAVKEAGGQRLTETGLSIGTPQYMSPEQATAERQLDARSDVYSLGAVLYEMLAGEPPFTGVTAQAVIAKLMVERPTSLRTVRDTIPVGLEAVVAQALAKVPADRFPSAAAFAAALAAPEAHRAPSRLPKRALLGGGAAIIVLAAAAVWLLPQLRQDRLRATPVEPTLEQVTFTGNAKVAVVSPDGKQVAYAAKTCRSLVDCTYAIVVENLRLAERRTLADGFTDAYQLTWSPDQSFLLLNGSRGTGFRDYLLSTLGAREQDLGCCRGMFLGSADTVLQAVVGATEPPQRWFSLTTREGVRVDSMDFAVSWIIPSPAGRRLLLWWLWDYPSETFYVATRDGRVTDSLVFASEERPSDAGTGPVAGVQVPQGMTIGERLVWTASGDGVLVFVRSGPERSNLWAVVRFSISEDGRIHRPADTLASRLKLPGFPRWDATNLMPPSTSGAVALSLGEPRYALWTLERPSLRAVPKLGRKLLSATGQLEALLSPDGKQILVARRSMVEGRPATQVEVWPFDGEGGTPLGTPQEGLVRVGWSRDSREVYRLAQGTAPGSLDLTAIEVSTGRARSVRTVMDSIMPLPPAWGLPDGLLLQRTKGSALGGTPLEWRSIPPVEGRTTVFNFPDTTRRVESAFFAPEGDTSWVAAAAAATLQHTSGTQDLREYAIYTARPGVPARLFSRYAGPWSTPTIMHADPGGALDAVAPLWASYELRWLHIEPGGPPVDLGPMPVRSIPAPFSSDGRRGVVVEKEDQTDVWLLKWPAVDSVRAGER